MSDSPSTPPSDPSFLKIPLKRRGFIGSLLGGTTALILQACGWDTSNRSVDITPSPSKTASPTASSIPSSTAAPSATASLTPTPRSSSTPVSLLSQQSVTPSATAVGESEVYLPFVAKPEELPTMTPSATAVPSATSTPEPTATSKPTVASEPSPEPTTPPEPTATAELTATPEPTVTPQPTATPIPSPTPIPPGPATKLGLFVGYLHPTLEQLLRTGNVAFVKTLEYDANLMAFIKELSPNTIVVARYTPLGQLDWNAVNPVAEARRFVELLLPIATEPKRFANIDAWESYNEPVPTSSSAMQRYAAFEAERTHLLAQEGIRSCVGNFATGLPALERWPDFIRAVQAVQQYDGYLGLHEYSAPYMWFGSGPYQLEPGVDEGDEGWLTLRYRKVYRQYLQPAGLEVPLLITEMGIDGQVGNRPGPPGLGWLDFREFWKQEGQVRTTPEAFYVEQLAWYDAELLQDPYVKGASIFALGATSGWETFELIGSCADILQQYFAVHPRR